MFQENIIDSSHDTFAIRDISPRLYYKQVGWLQELTSQTPWQTPRPPPWSHVWSSHSSPSFFSSNGQAVSLRPSSRSILSYRGTMLPWRESVYRNTVWPAGPSVLLCVKDPCNVMQPGLACIQLLLEYKAEMPWLVSCLKPTGDMWLLDSHPCSMRITLLILVNIFQTNTSQLLYIYWPKRSQIWVQC